MNPVLSAVLIVGAVVVVAGGYLFARLRRAKPAQVFYYNCQGCGRKFRYSKQQVGHKAMCPRCKQPFTFPAVSQK